MDVIGTGSFDLDRWLDGGYEKEIVTMIVGPPASGKTNFSLLCACSCALVKKVIFIDTEGGFSIERIKQIVGDKNFEKVLSNIIILKPFNFAQQKESFSKLRDFLNKDVGLVVVDSIAMLYRLELAKSQTSGLGDLESEKKIKNLNCEIVSQMEDLASIAREKNIPVLITNQVYSKFGKDLEDKEINIVGGDLFQYWSKCIIELKKGFNRKVVLLKHRCLPIKEFCFEIRNEGIVKRKGFF